MCCIQCIISASSFARCSGTSVLSSYVSSSTCTSTSSVMSSGGLKSLQVSTSRTELARAKFLPGSLTVTTAMISSCSSRTAALDVESTVSLPALLVTVTMTSSLLRQFSPYKSCSKLQKPTAQNMDCSFQLIQTHISPRQNASPG